MHRSLHKWKTYVSREAIKSYLSVSKLGFASSMNGYNKRRFNGPKIIQLFNRYATYNGSGFYQAPATLNIIPHLEFNIGAFYPVDGMYSITKSLYRLAEDLGVVFELDSRLNKILIENNEAIGLEVNKNAYYFSKVISNMDMVNTYKKLLPVDIHPKKLLNQPKSSSALIFFLGINKSFKSLGVQNIFFSKDYKEEFKNIFKDKTIHDDSTIYLNITSKYKKDDAPEGCENWFDKCAT